MPKILGIAILGAVLAGCDLTTYTHAVPTFPSVDAAQRWVSEDQGGNIHYALEGWYTAAETVALGRADCRGYAMLLGGILTDQFPQESFHLVEISEPAHPADAHVVLEWRGRWYSPQIYNLSEPIDPARILDTVTYARALLWCYQRWQ